MKQIKIKQSQKGYTLIEVLLVVVLIGILLTIGLVSLNTEARFIENRNDTRKNHIKTIEGAISQYRLQEGSYPTGLNRTYQEVCDPDASSCTGFFNLKTFLVPKYLQSIPQDPNDTDNTGGAGYEVAIDTTTNTVSVRLKELLREGGVIIAVNDPLPAESTTTANSSLAATVPVTPPPPWTPTQISTALWLDADDASTITLNGSTVSQWRDKSGNGRNVSQSTAANQPLLTSPASGINGVQTIQFDGTNDVLTTTISTNLSSSFCFFLVVTPLIVRGNMAYLASEVDSYSNYWAYLGTNPSTNNSSALFNGTLNPVAIGNVAVANTPILLQLDRVATNDLRLYQNGTLIATNTTNLTSIPVYSNFQIGAQVNVAGRYSNSKIGEVLVSPNTLTTTNRQLVEGYLAWKWGLVANLPADHPYKNSAPTI